MTKCEKLFGDCDRVARTYHEHGEGLYQCVRFTYSSCEGCVFEHEDCDSLDRYDASVEWLQEESD